MRTRFAPILCFAGLCVVGCDSPRTGPVTRDRGPALQSVDFALDTHFRCYIVSRETPDTPVTAVLSDQFIPTDTVKVKEPLQFCAPTSKNGSPILDSTAHLTMYVAPESLPSHLIVSTEDQFGPRTLVAVGARSLLVPTEKVVNGVGLGFPDTLNHFRCYEVTGDRVRTRVTLADQFGSDTVRVEAPHYFCPPAAKTIGTVTTPIFAPDEHLTCYDIFAPQRTQATDVGVRNQLEEDTFTITSFQLLCVPSQKLGVQPAS
ncbi:MAG TPA: hypothetical protein VN953_10555 [Gemmatimonadales bacterium]|nr:hypothetical protein [Gemmatimonadales bacterium]